MDGSLIAHLAATYGAGVVPAAVVGWVLMGHVRECSARRRHIHEEIDRLRHEVAQVAENVAWIRGKLE